MYYSFIFYGSLMDAKLLKKIVKHQPISTSTGYIKGEILAVSDPTEPNKIPEYPIAILNKTNTVIKAKLFVFDLTDDQFDEMMCCLLEFEGPLYKHEEVIFYSKNGDERRGLVFSANSKVLLDKHDNIKKIDPVENMYSWK